MRNGFNIGRLCFVLVLPIAILVGCSTVVQPPSVTFTASKDRIVEGDTVLLAWSVSAGEGVRYSVRLDANPEAASGSKKVVPIATTEYTLNVTYADTGTVRRVANVVVTPAPKPLPASPISTPIVEELSLTQSPYAKGSVNYQNVQSANGLTIDIFNVDLSEFPKKVRLLVTVKDANGNLVANLAPPYNNQHQSFWKSVAEDYSNANTAIDSFVVTEVRKADSRPASVVLVGDYSGSMANSIGELDAAIGYAMRYLGPADDYSLIQFDHRVVPVWQGIPGGTEKTRYSLQDLGGGTAFYDGSLAGLNSIAPSTKQKVAVLFTDGYDNSSYSTGAFDVANAAFKQNTRAFVIGFGGADQQILQAIATNANGKYYFPASDADLTQIYEEVFRTLDVHYVIEYTGKATSEPHSVKIIVAPANGPDVSASRTYVEKPVPIPEKGRAYLAGLFSNGSRNMAKPAEWKERLDQLAGMCKQSPESTVLIRGHSDTRGSNHANASLSKKRAQTIAQELMKRGVEKARIQIEAFGENQPVWPDDKAKWKAQENRRVEIVLL